MVSDSYDCKRDSNSVCSYKVGTMGACMALGDVRESDEASMLPDVTSGELAKPDMAPTDVLRLGIGITCCYFETLRCSIEKDAMAESFKS